MPSRRTPAGVLAAGLLIAASACTGGGSGPDGDPSASATTATPTPLADFDSSGVSIARGDFCDLLPEWAIEQALGARPVKEKSYGNGDRAEVVPGTTDIAHEYSCRWAAADGTLARAWVFAPPITRAAAEDLVADLREKSGGCRPITSKATFGQPSVARVCKGTGKSKGTTLIARSGLFVDAWLSCSIYRPATGASATQEQASDKRLLIRTGEWCVQVATSLDTTSASAPPSSSSSTEGSG